MRSMLLRCAVLIAVLSLLASCGGGSSGGSVAAETDFVSITVAGAGTTLYTETTSTQALYGYSPYLTISSFATPSIVTYLFSLDWNGSDYDPRFEIAVWGSGPGTYNIKSDNSLVYFTPAVGLTYSANSSIPAAGGTITFTEFGAPGQKVKGTFDVVSVIASAPSQTARLTGSFSVTRY